MFCIAGGKSITAKSRNEVPTTYDEFPMKLKITIVDMIIYRVGDNISPITSHKISTP